MLARKYSYCVEGFVVHLGRAPKAGAKVNIQSLSRSAIGSYVYPDVGEPGQCSHFHSFTNLGLLATVDRVDERIMILYSSLVKKLRS